MEVDPVTGVLKRDGVQSKMNPYDLYGLELALELAEKYGGTVETITMGPPQAKSVIIETICMGADKGTVLSYRRFAGADVLATAYTISQGIRKSGNFDIIICGKQTTDGDTAQVGAEVAEYLGLPNISNVLSVDRIENGKATVTASLDEKLVTMDITLPCLISTDGDINSPRLPSYKVKQAVTNDMIRFISLDDFEDRNPYNYGLSGSATQVERIFPPEKNTEKFSIGATNLGKQLAPRIAARCKAGLTADCTVLEMKENTDLVQIRPAFGGNIMAQIISPDTRPQFCTARYKVFAEPKPSDTISGEIVSMEISDNMLESAISILSCTDKPKDIDISESDVIVAVGRGASSEAMRSKAEELGGLVSGEHGIGYAKKGYLKKQYGETPIALMQGIKKVFDEKNILNPGKICF